VPSRPQVETSEAGHVAAERGFCPLGTGAQVPIASFVLQAMHVPVQAVSQQTPSTQKVDWQSLAQEQAWPGNFRAPASPQTGGFSAPPPSGPPPPDPALPRSEEVGTSLRASVDDEPPLHPETRIDAASTATIEKPRLEPKKAPSCVIRRPLEYGN
jgi:hypothetical protein